MVSGVQVCAVLTEIDALNSLMRGSVPGLFLSAGWSKVKSFEWGWATPISSAIVWHCLAPPKSKGSMEFTFLKVYEHLWRNFERQSSLYFDLGGLLRGNFENTKFFLS